MLHAFCVCLEEKRGPALLKVMGADTSVLSHLNLNSHLHELLEYEMYLASAGHLQHTHTERDSFLTVISCPATLKSVAKLHLQESPSCNIVKGSRKVLGGRGEEAFPLLSCYHFT